MTIPAKIEVTCTIEPDHVPGYARQATHVVVRGKTVSSRFSVARVLLNNELEFLPRLLQMASEQLLETIAAAQKETPSC